MIPLHNKKKSVEKVENEDVKEEKKEEKEWIVYDYSLIEPFEEL